MHNKNTHQLQQARCPLPPPGRSATLAPRSSPVSAGIWGLSHTEAAQTRAKPLSCPNWEGSTIPGARVSAGKAVPPAAGAGSRLANKTPHGMARRGRTARRTFPQRCRRPNDDTSFHRTQKPALAAPKGGRGFSQTLGPCKSPLPPSGQEGHGFNSSMLFS